MLQQILLVTATLVFSACAYDIEKVPQPLTVLAPGTVVNFDSVYVSVLRPVCLECHAAPRNAAGINLETYESVVANQTRVQSAVASKFMPESQGRGLTVEQCNLLLAWIEAGAPRDTSPPGSNPPTAPGPPPAPAPGPCLGGMPPSNSSDDDCQQPKTMEDFL